MQAEGPVGDPRHPLRREMLRRARGDGGARISDHAPVKLDNQLDEGGGGGDPAPQLLPPPLDPEGGGVAD